MLNSPASSEYLNNQQNGSQVLIDDAPNVSQLEDGGIQQTRPGMQLATPTSSPMQFDGFGPMRNSLSQQSIVQGGGGGGGNNTMLLASHFHGRDSVNSMEGVMSRTGEKHNKRSRNQRSSGTH